jgi:hypothetical protein
MAISLNLCGTLDSIFKGQLVFGPALLLSDLRGCLKPPMKIDSLIEKGFQK